MFRAAAGNGRSRVGRRLTNSGPSVAPGAFGLAGWVLCFLIVAAAFVGGLGVISNLTLWLTSALLALSLQFIWGYGGMLSFCQNAFYGVGAYTFGVIGMNLSSPGTTVVFIVGSGVASALVSAALGYFMFYGRINDVAVAITTYAFTLVLATIATGLQFDIGKAMIGGANGLTGIPPLAIGTGHLPAALGPVPAFFMTLIVVALSWWALGRLRASLRGRVLDASRQNDERCVLLGYDVRIHRLGAFVISAGVAGVAGGLFAAWAQFVNPSQFSAESATLVVVWVLVGGRRSPTGTVAGAILISAVQYYLGGGTLGAQATLILGIIAVIVILLTPDGLAALAAKPLERRLGRRRQHGPVEVDLAGADVGAQSISNQSPQREETLLPGATVGTPRGAAHGDGPLLRVVDVSKSFGGVHAVREVSLEVRLGDIHCIIGPNGAGKSTFFNVLVGRLALDQGSIQFDGQDISRLPTFKRARLGIGVKLQTASFFPELTVRENLWLAARATESEEAAVVTVAQCLQDARLQGVSHETASSLSHGQQQWLEIGMVLAQRPTLVLLDEPVAGMTVGEREQTVAMVRDLAKRCAVIVVEHDMSVVEQLGGEVTVMHEGAVLRRGDIRDLRQDEEIMDAYLGRENADATRVRTGPEIR